MIWLEDAKYIKEFKVLIKFNTGQETEIDLENYMKSAKGQVFEPLKYISNFSAVKLNADTNTIEWPNGADIAPERLYELYCSMH